MTTPHHHRPSLKQANKGFKSRHASKGSLKAAAKGRIGGAEGGKQRTIARTATSKADRRNTAKQLKNAKRAAVVEQGRLTRGLEGRAPRVVAVVALCADVTANDVVEELLTATDDIQKLQSSSGASNVQQVDLAQPRATLQFLSPAHGNLLAVLDAVAVADFVVLSLSGTTEVDEWGETCIRSLASLGVGEGAVRAVVSAMPENHVAGQQVRKSLLSFVKHFFPALDRIHAPSVPSESANLLRSLGDRLPRSVSWRETRPRVLAEQVEWQGQDIDINININNDSKDASSDSTGMLAITGFVRGSHLSANRLVHLQGYGDFQIDRIVSASSSHPRRSSHPSKSQKGIDAAMDEARDVVDQVLSRPDLDDADDLASTNVPSEGNDLLAEQTWPTEEEIASAPANLTSVTGNGTSAQSRRLVRVPKGTSSYQAAWLVDVDDDEQDEEYSDDEGNMHEDGDAAEPSHQPEEDEEEYEYVDPDADSVRLSASVPSTNGFSNATGTGVSFRDLPNDIEEAQYADYLAAKRDADADRRKEAKDDAEFPDEVDTPLDIPARERFARYRGLKSFRTSAWDPYENLPKEYSRIFMFQNWKTMGRRLAQRAAEDGVEPGTRVTIYLRNVPRSIAQRPVDAAPLVLFGLLKHEHKYSVVHFTAIRNTEFTADIRSKDPLILQLGCRRYAINPIWSQHTHGNGGKGSNNVHKFERYLHPGPSASVGSAYLPITFGTNVPAIVFRQSNEKSGIIDLVSTGTLLGADPTRIVAKRIILTGHPYKVHKKTATIRYLFFNQADVDYFKPVELRTKKGRVGHIHESLGTHGYLKAGFDGPIDQMDTICLNLYKRCFPKWGKPAELMSSVRNGSAAATEAAEVVADEQMA